MSTVAKPQQAANPAPRPATASVKRPSGATFPKTEPAFLFDKENYMWMIGGIALIFIGFLLMAGGKSANPHEFHYDEIYSFRRITLSPIIILLGFAVEVYAIMKKPNETPRETPQQ
jgi:DUF3098 family protein